MLGKCRETLARPSPPEWGRDQGRPCTWRVSHGGQRGLYCIALCTCNTTVYSRVATPATIHLRMSIQSKAPLRVVCIVSPPVHHHGPCRAQEKEDEQQIQVVPRIKRSTADVRPLVPPLVTVAVQVKVEDCSDKKSRKGPRAQISAEGGCAGKEDGRVPQVEPVLGKFHVQEPDDGRRRTPNQEPVQDGCKVRGCKESFGPDQGIHDSGRVVALEILPRPLARRVRLCACDVVVLGREHPPHHAVVYDKTNDVGNDLNANYVSWWNVEVVTNLLKYTRLAAC